jgi:hypothetical protein
MYFVRISEQTAAFTFNTVLADWFCTTEVENVYCVVRTQSLNALHTLS